MKCPRNSILLLWWLLLPGLLWAQEIQWSSTLEIPRDTYIRNIIGEDEDGSLIVLRHKGGSEVSRTDYWLERHRPDMSLEWSKRLFIPLTDNAPHRFGKLMLVDGQLVLFTSFFQKQSRSNYAFATTLTRDGEKLGETTFVDTILVEKLANPGTYDFQTSEDGKRILLYRSEPYEKFTDARFHLKVLDSKAKLIWQQHLHLDYKSRQFEVEKCRLDNRGNVHLLARINHTESISRKDESRFHYNLLSYNPETNDLREYEIKLPKRAVSDITFKIDTDGNLLTAGFYSNEANAENYVGGTFFLRIDPITGGITGKGMKDFDKAFISNFIGEKKAERGKELYNYAIDHFIDLKDGGFMIIGEQSVKTVTCHPDPRTGFEVCNDNYYFNDIIVVNFNAEGGIRWAKRVPKRQHSINDHGFYSSYLSCFANDTLRLAYNDHPDNLNMSNDERPKTMTNLRKSVVTLVQIDAYGNITKKPLFATKDNDITLRPKIHSQVSPNAVIIFGQRKRNYQVGRLSFPIW